MSNSVCLKNGMFFKAGLCIAFIAVVIFMAAGCKEAPIIGAENYDASVSLISFELIDDEFDGVIYREVTDFSKLAARSEIPLLVAFYQQMNDINIDVMPVLEELAVSHDNRIQIVWIDAGREAAIAEQFSVRQTPQFVIVDDAIIKRSLTGFSDQGRKDLMDLITPYLD